MKGALQIGLKANDKIYINGAVLSVDRKVRIALLNEATFLLGKQVMQLEEATSPVRRLYFLIQSTLIDPKVTASLRPAIDAATTAIACQSLNGELISSLQRMTQMIEIDRPFEALKIVRTLMALEDGGVSAAARDDVRRNVA